MIKPIKTLHDVDRIREHLRNNPRDLFLFDLATQTGCKLQQALKFKVSDISHCQEGDFILGNQEYLENGQKLLMTARLYRSFNKYIMMISPGENEYVFKSRKGNSALNPTSASRLISSWFEKVGLDDLSGYSSLLKTWESFFRESFIGSPKDTNPSLNSVLKPVSTLTRQETVYQHLHEAILHGEIPPGTRLKNDQLASIFKVSDTPIREALARLRAEGVITRTDHKGYVVQKLTSEDLHELVRIRVTLECMAAKEACLCITDQEIEGLSQLQTPQPNINQDLKAYFRFNKIFHKSIYEAANMPTLLAIIENLWDKMSPYFNLLADEITQENPNLNWEQHSKIIEGFRRQDPDYVCDAVTEDITYFASHIIKKMEQVMD
jgi:DNA-binding GntR family transcriptional regulator